MAQEIRVEARTTGGRRLRRELGAALRASGVDAVKVGFFSTAKYPDGTLVAGVAARNEFGFTGGEPDQRIPERPFFRQALERSKPEVSKILEDGVDSKRNVVDPRLGDIVGLRVTEAIQSRITSLRHPPNSPVTIERKGSSNPLIDTGQMRQSATWRIER